ncbi:unnamed protein product [Camellia sinensis]
MIVRKHYIFFLFSPYDPNRVQFFLVAKMLASQTSSEHREFLHNNEGCKLSEHQEPVGPYMPDSCGHDKRKDYRGNLKDLQQRE